MYLLYSALLSTGMFLSLPYWIFQMVRYGKYRRGFLERLGRVPSSLPTPSSGLTIWIHAVSVGEVLAISGLVDEMHLRCPACPLVVSTTTDTGQKLARTRCGRA